MSVRLLFDENFGQPLVRALAQLLKFHKPEPEVVHLLDFIDKRGEKDEVWVPAMAGENWIVVSADKGSRGGASKLPRICRTNGVTHVVLVGRIIHYQQFERARAILVVWPQLLTRVADADRGSRFKLKLVAGRPDLDAG